ncbi:MAG: hypothetical protein J1E82_05510 [Muribaculaceae bacterium]|nr:hypothetical protein [Muribaculaceae bacterium]
MKRVKYLLVIIISFFLSINENTIMANEGSQTGIELSLFVDSNFEPWRDLGKRLEKHGFKLQSKKRIPSKDGYAPYTHIIYKKGGYKVIYNYYPEDNLVFSIKIKFPSKSTLNYFKNSVPRNMIYENTEVYENSFSFFMDEDYLYRLDFFPDDLEVDFFFGP